MERVIHDLIQGTDEWHQFRLEHDGASEAAAMLGLSKKVTRSELLRQKHTGEAREFSAFVQERILDHGHEVEAMARPMAEDILADELFPATYSYGRLSASCDGLTMDGETAFEHKQWNADLAAAVKAGELPDEHQPQCQQIIMATGVKRVLFMVSNGTPDQCEYVMVLPDPVWQSRIEAGWKQFNEDLANYQHVELAPTAVAKPINDLPALMVEITGSVTQSNLPQWKAIVTERIEGINTDLKTDQDFADADKMVKFLDDGEKRIDVVKSQAQAQAVSIDEVFRALDDIKASMRAKRLELDRLVKARKDSIRGEIQQGGKSAFAEHIAGLNTRLGKPYMPPVPADFAAVMKGKKSIASLRDAVDTELARAKIEANAIADRIQINLATLRELAADHSFLFSDTAQIVIKANDDLTALVKTRIAEHKAAHERKLEAERERIRAEEQAKAASEATARQRAELAALEAAKPAPVTLEQVIQTVAPAAVANAIAPPSTAKPAVKLTPAGPRPTDDAIIDVLSLHYRVHESKVIEWLLAMDLNAASQRLLKTA